MITQAIYACALVCTVSLAPMASGEKDPAVVVNKLKNFGDAEIKIIELVPGIVDLRDDKHAATREELTRATYHFVPLVLKDDRLVHEFFERLSHYNGLVRADLRIMLVTHLADAGQHPPEERIKAIRRVLSSGGGNKTPFYSWYLYPDMCEPKKTEKPLLLYMCDKLAIEEDQDFMAFVEECKRQIAESYKSSLYNANE